jgi:hypothetical protein
MSFAYHQHWYTSFYTAAKNAYSSLLLGNAAWLVPRQCAIVAAHLMRERQSLPARTLAGTVCRYHMPICLRGMRSTAVAYVWPGLP